MNEIMALRHYKVKKFLIDQFLVFVLEILKKSEQILNILNIDWKF